MDGYGTIEQQQMILRERNWFLNIFSSGRRLLAIKRIKLHRTCNLNPTIEIFMDKMWLIVFTARFVQKRYVQECATVHSLNVRFAWSGFAIRLIDKHYYE